jgi:hypothetical protein
MQTMSERSELIEALEARGFKAGKLRNDGWLYQHPDTRVSVWFDSTGKFRVSEPGYADQIGVAQSPTSILERVDAKRV